MRVLTILIMTLFLFSCDKEQVSSTVGEKIPEKKSDKTTVEKTEEQEEEFVATFTSNENNDPEEESDYVKINRLYKLAKKKGFGSKEEKEFVEFLVRDDDERIRGDGGLGFADSSIKNCNFKLTYKYPDTLPPLEKGETVLYYKYKMDGYEVEYFRGYVTSRGGSSNKSSWVKQKWLEQGHEAKVFQVFKDGSKKLIVHFIEEPVYF